MAISYFGVLQKQHNSVIHAQLICAAPPVGLARAVWRRPGYHSTGPMSSESGGFKYDTAQLTCDINPLYVLHGRLDCTGVSV